jgi:hypothetical protein
VEIDGDGAEAQTPQSPRAADNGEERANRRAFYLQNYLVLETFKSLTDDFCDDANEEDSGSPVYT